MTPHSAMLSYLLSCLLLVVSAQTMPNFIAQDDLSDGQHEIRIHYNGVTAKQTSVTSEQGSVSGLVLRQVHQHHQLLTLVYVGQAADDLSVDGLSLRDCRIAGDPGEVAEFLRAFEDDAEVARTTAAAPLPSASLHNVTFLHLYQEAELPEYMRPVLHFKRLRAQCRDHRRNVKKAIRAQRRAEKRNHKSHHNHHHHHHNNNNNNNNNNNSQEQSHSRSRRWILKEFFILPGTKWCGNDDIATSYRDLDGHHGADRCCRKHDKCPLNIRGLQYRFGAYNPQPTTVSHCLCDERFKACLKMTGTAVADLVGDVFFNKIKTKCFNLERKKVCTKWASWFGPCTKYSVKQVAVLRDNAPYKF